MLCEKRQTKKVTYYVHLHKALEKQNDKGKKSRLPRIRTGQDRSRQVKGERHVGSRRNPCGDGNVLNVNCNG